ncbi:MAG: metallophosphoesterase [Actinomycetota bacterium]
MRVLRRLRLPAAVVVVVAAALAAAPASGFAEPGGGAVARNSHRSVHVVAAGDIACDPNAGAFHDGEGTGNYCRQMATSDLWVNDPTVEAAFALGDLQYEDGALWKFNRSYDPSWGRGFGVTYPAPGNHEYQIAGAAGYFAYFGARTFGSTGWYSADIGRWHVISLNSTCPPVNCSGSSPQLTWLRDDLRANDARCTLAFFHHPIVASVGPFGDPVEPQVRPFMRALYEAGADVVLNGHQHTYERFARADWEQNKDAAGIRQFIAGTGGSGLHRQDMTIAPNSQVRRLALGVLHLELRTKRYVWWFENLSGQSLDEGATTCR